MQGDGRVGPSPGTPSLADVAQLAGVSEATASRVLAQSRRVRPDLVDRVRVAATKLDYTPNPHARALASSRDASVGVVVHELSDPYFSEIVRGALERAEESDRMVLICNTYRDVGRELAYIRHFRAQRVDALLLAGSGRIDRELSRRIGAELLSFERAGGQAVLIGRHQVTGDTVRPDNIGGGRLMARHLVELGHRDIGVISGPELLTTSVDRLQGFRSELVALGVELREERVVQGDFSRCSGEAAMGTFLETMPEVTAVFALNDVMAVGAYNSLRRHGRRVPQDVSLAGFDDIPLAADLSPALTTIAVQMPEIGRAAFDLATGPRMGDYRTEHIATSLVVRGSTAPRP